MCTKANSGRSVRVAGSGGDLAAVPKAEESRPSSGVNACILNAVFGSPKSNSHLLHLILGIRCLPNFIVSAAAKLSNQPENCAAFRVLSMFANKIKKYFLGVRRFLAAGVDSVQHLDLSRRFAVHRVDFKSVRHQHRPVSTDTNCKQS